MPRRKPGTLLPLELRILETGLAVQAEHDHFHGFLLATQMSDGSGDARTLTAHGTLYKALGRMAQIGLLEASWEDPSLGEEAGRPRRRLYRVTPEGAVALASARAEQSSAAAFSARGLPAGGLT